MPLARLLLIAVCAYVTCGVSYAMLCVDQVRPTMAAVDADVERGDLPTVARPLVAVGIFVFILVVWPISLAFDVYLKLRRRP